jgi:hypothetical protein
MHDDLRRLEVVLDIAGDRAASLTYADAHAYDLETADTAIPRSSIRLDKRLRVSPSRDRRHTARRSNCAPFRRPANPRGAEDRGHQPLATFLRDHQQDSRSEDSKHQGGWSCRSGADCARWSSRVTTSERKGASPRWRQAI